MREGFFFRLLAEGEQQQQNRAGDQPRSTGLPRTSPAPPPRLRLLLPAAPVVGRPLPWQRGAAEGRGLTAGYEEQVEYSG